MKRISIFISTILLIGSFYSPSYGSEADWTSEKYFKESEAIKSTVAYLLSENPKPQIGAVGGEWTIIGLASSGDYVPNSYYEEYYNRVESSLESNNGILTRNKYTEYSRLIIALGAIRKDAKNVGGYNIFDKLGNMEDIIKQGINGPIYALIAIDSGGYSFSNNTYGDNTTTRQGLIDYILQREIINNQGIKGGFSLMAGDMPDADITGMVLQALAPYRNQPLVEQAINRGLDAINRMEKKDGSFESWGTETSESIVQVIVAKCALGIDPSKNVEALMRYYVKDGGFEHQLGQGSNLLATEQGLYALAAYRLLITENRGLYDFPVLQNGICVLIDGKQIEFDQPPVNIEGRVLVPVRGIFEAFGATVSWDPNKRQVKGSYDNNTIILSIDDTKAYINGTQYILDVPAKIVGGRTMVPVRFISESLSANVSWSQKDQSVLIETR